MTCSILFIIVITFPVFKKKPEVRTGTTLKSGFYHFRSSGSSSTSGQNSPESRDFTNFSEENHENQPKIMSHPLEDCEQDLTSLNKFKHVSKDIEIIPNKALGAIPKQKRSVTSNSTTSANSNNSNSSSGSSSPSRWEVAWFRVKKIPWSAHFHIK